MNKKLIILISVLIFSILASVYLHFTDEKSMWAMASMMISQLLVIVVCIMALKKRK